MFIIVLAVRLVGLKATEVVITTSGTTGRNIKMFNRTNLQLFLGACAMFTISGAVQIQNNDHNETFTKLSNSHFLDTKSENFSLNSSFRASTDADSTCAADEGDTSSLDEFPEYFTEDQLRQGFVVLHIIGVVYFFVLLALICNNYFLPTVECICEDLNLSKDVAAATFMSTATTMPEFFTNTVSVLITDSDMGLGTIIGSLMFNTLGVAGIAALAIKKPVQLDWWPIARDCCIYSFNTILLLILAWGGRVTFVESAIMVAFLIVYYVITFFNSRLMPTMRGFIEDRLNCCHSTRYDLTEPPENSAKAQLPCNEHHPDINGLFTVSGSLQKDPPPLAHSADGKHHLKESTSSSSSSSSSLESGNKLFAWPRSKSNLMKCWWGFTFPLELVLKCLIPNPITHRKFYPLTFVACVLLIGANAFMIVWMLTAIGVAMGVPEIIMGLTILAAGSAMPEAISSTIALRSGESGIGVSNSLGANSLAILLSLGVPWFIKNCMHYNKTDGANAIVIATHGIGYNILILMFCTISLFLTLSIGNYRLTKRVGAALICVYSVFIVLQVLLETNMFFPRVC